MGHGRQAWSRAPASASPTPVTGRSCPGAFWWPMTHTFPAADRPGGRRPPLQAGAAADAATLRALEFGAVIEMLAVRTAFTPSRELAEASVPVADSRHVA